MSVFPTSTTTSEGRTFETQNQEEGNFTGVITDIRAITSDANKTLFGVIDIHVKGKTQPFQFYLNYNPDTKVDDKGTSPEYRSVTYLVSSAKDLIKACGDVPTAGAPRTTQWCEQVFTKYMNEKTEFRFHQGRDKRGLNITFIPKGEDTDENTESKDEVDL